MLVGAARPAQQKEARVNGSTPALRVLRKAGFGTHFKGKILTKLFKSFTSGRSSGEKQCRVELKTLILLLREPKQKHAALREMKRIFKRIPLVLVMPSWNSDVALDAGIEGWRAARPPFPGSVSDF